MRKFAIALAAAIVLSAGAAMAAVNLNTATEQQLESLNGVGPAKAQAIISYRNTNGPFKSVQDLSKVPGFGEKMTASLSSQLSISGPTTAPATTAASNANSPAATPSSTTAMTPATSATNAPTPANAPISNSKMPANSTSSALLRQR